MSQFNQCVSDKLMAEAIYNNNRDGMLVFFLIGCYPNRGGNPHHENPPILDQFKDNNTPYMTILIDPEYDNDYTPNYLQNSPKQEGVYTTGLRKTIIYKNSISKTEFHQILELANLVSHLNCASFIADFTGIRRDYAAIDNPSVYITPFNCLADVSTMSYNPLFEQNANGGYDFYNPQTIESIYREFKTLMNASNNNQLLGLYNQKMNHIGYFMKRLISKMKCSHLKILNVIDNVDDQMWYVTKQRNVAPVYDTNASVGLLERSIKHLYYRCQGYNLNLVKDVVRQWQKSNVSSLRDFITVDIHKMTLYAVKMIQRNDNPRLMDEYILGKNNTYKNIFDRITNVF